VNSILHFSYFVPDYQTFLLPAARLTRVYYINVEGLERPFSGMDDNSLLASLKRNTIIQQPSVPVPGYYVVICGDPTKRRGLYPVADRFLLEGEGAVLFGLTNTAG
jgi:hypothetical protein